MSTLAIIVTVLGVFALLMVVLVLALARIAGQQFERDREERQANVIEFRFPERRP